MHCAALFIRGANLPMQLEADEIACFAAALEAAQVMLAGGKKDVWRAGFAVADRGQPRVAVGMSDSTAMPRRTWHPFLRRARAGCIQNAARERKRLKGKGASMTLPPTKAQIANDGSAEIERVDAGLTQIVDGFAAEKLAADLVSGPRVPFRAARRRGPSGGKAQATMAPAVPPPMTR